MYCIYSSVYHIYTYVLRIFNIHIHTCSQKQSCTMKEDPCSSEIPQLTTVTATLSLHAAFAAPRTWTWGWNWNHTFLKGSFMMEFNGFFSMAVLYMGKWMLRFVHNTKIQLMIADVCLHSRYVFWYLTTHHSNLSSSKHWFHWAPTGNSRIRERVFAAFSVAGSSGQNRTVNHRVGKSPGFAVSLVSQCWIFGGMLK